MSKEISLPMHIEALSELHGGHERAASKLGIPYTKFMAFKAGSAIPNHANCERLGIKKNIEVTYTMINKNIDEQLKKKLLMVQEVMEETGLTVVRSAHKGEIALCFVSEDGPNYDVIYHEEVGDRNIINSDDLLSVIKHG